MIQLPTLEILTQALDNSIWENDGIPYAIRYTFKDGHFSQKELVGKYELAELPDSDKRDKHRYFLLKAGSTQLRLRLTHSNMLEVQKATGTPFVMRRTHSA